MSIPAPIRRQLRHFTSPHMAEFGAALGGLGLRGMDVKKYVVTSEGGVP